MTPAPPIGAAGRTSRRVVGVDVARACALIGMFSVHILPIAGPDGRSTTVDVIASGRSAALFAVCAGVGIALATGGNGGLRGGTEHLVAGVNLLIRAVLVGLLGMLLVELDPPVAVILSYYGVLFVVAIPLLRLRQRTLAGLAVLCCVLTPVLSHLLRATVQFPSGTAVQPGLAALYAPGELITMLALTGYYPVLQWTTYLLAGLAVGRLDLRRARTAVGLLITGVVLAVGAWLLSVLLLGPLGGAGRLGVDPLRLDRTRYGTTPTDSWWWLAVPAAHSSTPIDLAHTTGTALAVLGAGLLLAGAVPPLGWLVGAVGAVPLTLYTAHVVALAIYPGKQPGLLIGHLIAATVLAVLIRLTGRRGPLEAAVAAAGRAAARLVGDPARAGPGAGR